MPSVSLFFITKQKLEAKASEKRRTPKGRLSLDCGAYSAAFVSFFFFGRRGKYRLALRIR
jgi:hypothetical protein